MITPIGNRLLVEPVKDLQTTASGFVLKDPDTLSTTKCEIVRIGADCERFWHLGEIVLVPKQAFIEATELPIDKTVAISEDDVIAVITPDSPQE